MLAPRFELVGLDARRGIRFVDLTGGALDIGGDAALGGFTGEVEREVVGADAVDLVFLTVASLTAAVEDVVELPAIRAVKDLRERVCSSRSDGYLRSWSSDCVKAN